MGVVFSCKAEVSQGSFIWDPLLGGGSRLKQCKLKVIFEGLPLFFCVFVVWVGSIMIPVSLHP